MSIVWLSIRDVAEGAATFYKVTVHNYFTVLMSVELQYWWF